ncbi:unnamed protein product [Brachionus calyciflorus]|uniref:BTB domain-containing protein n=1 Tax=Brachionus calyciflorus TaxID=104777 RepID=A0A814EN55_9BILA|nr:unnamed protein product [Brachionus calyciflorus]
MAILSIWSNVFEIMLKSNFKEKEFFEVYLMDQTYDNIHELLRVIYPPNKRITLVNIKRMLELADEYQMNELSVDVVNRCSDHLMYTLTSTIITNDIEIKEVNTEIMNTVLISRIKHLESVIEKLIKKAGSACLCLCLLTDIFYEKQTITLGFIELVGGHSAENVKKAIETTVKSFNFDKSKIRGFVSDEESSLVRLFGQIFKTIDSDSPILKEIIEPTSNKNRITEESSSFNERLELYID